MSSSLVLGQFLWHELLTSDPEAGAGFYSKVLGWNSRPWEGDAGYSMLAAPTGPVGGARVVGKDSLASMAGPNWLTYVGVPDLAAALATAENHGGRVLHPVTAIPDGGRYAVIADPQGGIIGLYEPAGDMGGSNAAPAAGPVAWHELTADDPEAALQFYNTLFGWEVLDRMPMGGEVGTYYLFGTGTTQLGGAFKRPAHLPPTWPRWLVYLRVPSVSAAVAAVEAAGGQLLNGPHEVPGGSWVAQVADSHGVPVALNGPKEVAAAKPKPAAARKPAAAKPAVKAKAKAAAPVKPKAKAKAKTKAKAKAKTATRVRAKATTAAKKSPKVRTKRRSAARAKAKHGAKRVVRKKARRAPRGKK
ncbi:MAG TPA: VOC family protein [Steroidobacteraceae bacterium]|nr:VOC family protein [Steroidobacteraceae bacterium]